MKEGFPGDVLSNWRRQIRTAIWIQRGRQRSSEETFSSFSEAHWLSIFCKSDTFKMPSESRVQCFICFFICLHNFQTQNENHIYPEKTKLGCLFKHNKGFYSLTLVFLDHCDGESVCPSLGVVGGKMSLY